MRETFDLELVQYFWIIFFTSLQLHCKAPKGTGHEGVGLPATQSPTEALWTENHWNVELFVSPRQSLVMS